MSEDWYHGQIYGRFISWFQRPLMKLIGNIIPEGACVIDIACGTGEFAFQNPNKFNKIIGIDLSQKNIDYANRLLNKKKLDNIEFIQGNAQQVNEIVSDKLDYAVISYALHEMPPDIRLNVLKSARMVSDKLIIADYSTPQPNNSMGLLNHVVEYFAGSEHFRNYLNFNENNGLQELAQRAGLEITHQYKIRNKSNHIIIAQ